MQTSADAEPESSTGSAFGSCASASASQSDRTLGCRPAAASAKPSSRDAATGAGFWIRPRSDIRLPSLGVADRGVSTRLSFPGPKRGSGASRLYTVPLGRFSRPEDVARAICHLASDEASHTNGMLYPIDGGATAGYFFGGGAGASAP